jgi:hypothetical protein
VTWQIKLAAWLVAIVTGLAGVGAVYIKGQLAGRAQLQRKWDADKAVQEALALGKERDLQARMERLREEKTREIDRLVREHAADVDRLRERAERPREVAQAPSPRPAAAGCRGSELYREDAAFLVGEAARAERLRLELLQCRAAYNQAREQTQE